MELSACEQLEALFPEATVIRRLTMTTSQRTQVGDKYRIFETAIYSATAAFCFSL